MVPKININEEYVSFLNLYYGQTLSRKVTHNARTDAGRRRFLMFLALK